MHPLTFVHHTSTYQASMCKLIEYWLESNDNIYISTDVLNIFLGTYLLLNVCSLSPAINALQDRIRENETRVKTKLNTLFFINI